MSPEITRSAASKTLAIADPRCMCQQVQDLECHNSPPFDHFGLGSSCQRPLCSNQSFLTSATYSPDVYAGYAYKHGKSTPRHPTSVETLSAAKAGMYLAYGCLQRLRLLVSDNPTHFLLYLYTCLFNMYHPTHI